MKNGKTDYYMFKYDMFSSEKIEIAIVFIMNIKRLSTLICLYINNF